MVEHKLNKEAKHVLEQSLKVLEYAMDMAVQKDDLDAMIGISDRLMMLYQHLADKNVKKFKPGFSLSNREEEINDESDK
ncbi:hypothetical protein UFOVP204_50 [uncultured Caudovirales phage]|uniref:Uncharacterized protein n=1 Tax=uncultured Caudovirales phage TaxID=2100421 RepID=A0A6J7WMZ0_9CAUD|nr:hypothetical protein UFOVP204_50 [uncultured Caudovirales phage]